MFVFCCRVLGVLLLLLVAFLGNLMLPILSHDLVPIKFSDLATASDIPCDHIPSRMRGIYYLKGNVLKDHVTLSPASAMNICQGSFDPATRKMTIPWAGNGVLWGCPNENKAGKVVADPWESCFVGPDGKTKTISKAIGAILIAHASYTFTFIDDEMTVAHIGLDIDLFPGLVVNFLGISSEIWILTVADGGETVRRCSFRNETMKAMGESGGACYTAQKVVAAGKTTNPDMAEDYKRIFSTYLGVYKNVVAGGDAKEL